MKNISPWTGFRSFTLHCFLHLILAQIHLHIFNLAYRIRIMINILKTEKLLFGTNIKLENMRLEKIKIWEGVSQSQESHNEILLLKIYNVPANIYFFKVNKWSLRSRHRCNVFILNSAHDSHHFLEFLLLTINRKMFIWIASSDYDTISVYIDFFQTIMVLLSSTRTNYTIV